MRGCSGKIAYDTRAAAVRALGRVTERRGKDADPLTAYHCEACESFHLGRNPKHQGPKHRPWIDMVGKTRRYYQLVRGG